MESSWRQNVFELGLDGIDGHLCSRLHRTQTDTWILTNEVTGNVAIGWLPPSGLSQLYHFGYFVKGHGHPHFPYGYPVEPDEHA